MMLEMKLIEEEKEEIKNEGGIRFKIRSIKVLAFRVNYLS